MGIVSALIVFSVIVPNGINKLSVVRQNDIGVFSRANTQ
jgi:hypothetical protein